MFIVAKHIVEFNYSKESSGLVPKELENDVETLYKLLLRLEISTQ